MATAAAVEDGVKAEPRGGVGLRAGLWIAQVLLAAAFGMAGAMKLVKTGVFVEELHFPVALVLFIGVAELAGALGVVLPSLSRVAPRLTPLAAAGLATIMLLATGFHIMHGQYGALRATLVLGALAVFVAWGRFRGAPIKPR